MAKQPAQAARTAVNASDEMLMRTALWVELRSLATNLNKIAAMVVEDMTRASNDIPRKKRAR
jgi:hypothetical protein